MAKLQSHPVPGRLSARLCASSSEPPRQLLRSKNPELLQVKTPWLRGRSLWDPAGCLKTPRNPGEPPENPDRSYRLKVNHSAGRRNPARSLDRPPASGLSAPADHLRPRSLAMLFQFFLASLLQLFFPSLLRLHQSSPWQVLLFSPGQRHVVLSQERLPRCTLRGAYRPEPLL